MVSDIFFLPQVSLEHHLCGPKTKVVGLRESKDGSRFGENLYHGEVQLSYIKILEIRNSWRSEKKSLKVGRESSLN